MVSVNEKALKRLLAQTKSKQAIARVRQAMVASINFIKRPARLKWHLLTMIVLALTVFLGSSHASSDTPAAVASAVNSGAASTNSTVSNVSPLVNPAATVYIAATVATELNLPMADQVVAQANQVATTATTTDVDSQSQSLTKPDVVSTPGATRHSTLSYKVKNGDTLASVSQKFGVSSNTIEWANSLSDQSQLLPNSVLNIPPANGVLYVVKQGDTADSIASAFHSTADKIINFNDLEISGVKPGQQIMVPDDVKPPVRLSASIPTGFNFKFSPIFAGNGYDYGFCTWYVAYKRAQAGVPIPSNWGDARDWKDHAAASGYTVSSTPTVGSIMWTNYRRLTEHVAYVETVSPEGITVSEMNYPRWGKVLTPYRFIPAAGYLTDGLYLFIN